MLKLASSLLFALDDDDNYTKKKEERKKLADAAPAFQNALMVKLIYVHVFCSVAFSFSSPYKFVAHKHWTISGVKWFLFFYKNWNPKTTGIIIDMCIILNMMPITYQSLEMNLTKKKSTKEIIIDNHTNEQKKRYILK